MNDDFDISLEVNQPKITLRPGQSATAEIIISSRNGVGRRCAVNVVFVSGHASWFVPDATPMLLGSNKSAVRSIRISVPENADAEEIKFRPIVYAVDKPDEIFTTGPWMTLVVARGSEPKIHHPKWFIPLTILFSLIIIAGIIVGARYLADIGSNYAFRKSFIGIVKDKSVGDTVVVNTDFWQNEMKLDRFLQKTYDKCDRPSVDDLARALRITVSGAQREVLLTGLGGIVGDGNRCAFTKDEIDRAIDRHFTNDRSNAALYRPVSSTCRLVPPSACALTDDGNRRTGVSSDTLCGAPSLEFDLCYERIISRIDLYDSLGNDTKKGFTEFTISVLDERRKTVWKKKLLKQWHGHMQLYVPDRIGRYVSLSQKKDDFLKLSEVEIYEKNLAFSGTAGPMRAITDGDYTPENYCRIDSATPVVIDLGNAYVIKEVRVHISGSDSTQNMIVSHAEGIRGEAAPYLTDTTNRVLAKSLRSISGKADSILQLEGKGGVAELRITAPGYSTTVPVDTGGSIAIIQIPWITGTSISFNALTGIVKVTEVEVYGVAVKTDSTMNLALGKPSRQSSFSRNNRDFFETNAVDGVRGTKFARTAREKSPWLEVDLQTVSTIKRVSVFYDAESPLKNGHITVFDRAGKEVFDSSLTGSLADRYDVIPPAAVQGRWIRVGSRDTAVLSVAEIEAFGSFDSTEAVPIVSLGKNTTLSAIAAESLYTRSTNVALNKPATQSSTSGYPEFHYAKNGTDGNRAGDSFFATNKDSNPWWRVDLGDSYFIDSIIICNRTKCCTELFKNFSIIVFDKDTCQLAEIKGDRMITDPQIFKIPDMPFGRFCKIGITGRENLVLAEVEVYGKYKLPSGPAILTDGNTGPDARLGNVLTILPDTGGKAWVELDLLNMYEVESIVLYTGRSDDAGKNRVIAVTCLDDTKKRTGKAFSYAPENERVVVLPANVKNCRFVRVESAKGDSLPLAEIGVWGRSGNK